MVTPRFPTAKVQAKSVPSVCRVVSVCPQDHQAIAINKHRIHMKSSQDKKNNFKKRKKNTIFSVVRMVCMKTGRSSVFSCRVLRSACYWAFCPIGPKLLVQKFIQRGYSSRRNTLRCVGVVVVVLGNEMTGRGVTLNEEA